MPELPEVEVLTRSIRAYIDGQKCLALDVFNKNLREPVDEPALRNLLIGKTVKSVFRRGKYLCLELPQGHVLVHLGMSGRLLESASATPSLKHTHAVFKFASGYLHFVDPRRFGLIVCTSNRKTGKQSDVSQCKWLKDLGPEPLEGDLKQHLFMSSRTKKQPIKSFLMDASIVVGVGNIYASEALFCAGISPLRPASSLTLQECQRLARCIRKTLQAAIAAGGTTFRDYRGADGLPGYFKRELNVYDRAGEACKKCGNPLVQIRQTGRSTYFCRFCQK